MKKIILVFTAVILVLSLCGCSKQEDNSGIAERPYHEPTGATMEVDFSHAWKAEEIAMPDGFQPNCFYPTENAVIMSVYNINPQDDDVTNSGVVYDIASGEMKLLESHGVPIGATETDEGFQILWNVSRYDETENTYLNTGSLVTYDKNFQEISSEDKSGLFEKGYPNFWYQTEDGKQLICDSGQLYLYSADNTKIGQITGNLSGITRVFEGNGGQLYAFANWGDALIGEINLDEMKVTLLHPDGEPENPLSYAPAKDYDFYVTDSYHGLYGLKNGNAELLIDWVNSDVDSYGDIFPLSDGSFLKIDLESTQTRTFSTLLHLTERTQEEIDNMKIISLAALTQRMELTSILRKFNRQSDSCRIVLKDYEDKLSHSEGTWDNVINEFFNELISGTIPDILCLDGLDYMALSNKNMFEDWYPYMKNDPDFHEEEYLMNFFDAISYQGRHERFGLQSTVMTNAVKSQYLPEGAVTVQELAEVVDNMPEGMTVGGGADFPDRILTSLLDYEDYIDFDNHTCRFNSPDFIKLLEIANSQPKSGLSADPKAWVNDKALLKSTSFYGNDILDLEYFFFKDTDYSFVGIPNSEKVGNGGIFSAWSGFFLTMSADSLYKDEIWKFFKFCLSEEVQEKACYGMPIRLEAIQKYYEPYTNADYLSSGSWGDNYGNRSLPPATPEMIDRIIDYAKGISRVQFDNPKIIDIVEEETEMYFSGDQTAEKCAEMIQNRVSLYLSEQN